MKASYEGVVECQKNGGSTVVLLLRLSKSPGWFPPQFGTRLFLVVFFCHGDQLGSVPTPEVSEKKPLKLLKPWKGFKNSQYTPPQDFGKKVNADISRKEIHIISLL